MSPKGNIHRWSQTCSVSTSTATCNSLLKDYLFSEEIGLQSVTGTLALLLCVVFQEVHNQLVGGQDNGCVWDLPDELGKESSVEGQVPLLPCHQPCCLQESFVLGALLPQPRPDHLCTQSTASYPEKPARVADIFL